MMLNSKQCTSLSSAEPLKFIFKSHSLACFWLTNGVQRPFRCNKSKLCPYLLVGPCVYFARYDSLMCFCLLTTENSEYGINNVHLHTTPANNTVWDSRRNSSQKESISSTLGYSSHQLFSNDFLPASVSALPSSIHRLQGPVLCRPEIMSA